MDAAWRLIWALPLVLALGTAAILVLRRFIAPKAAAANVSRALTRGTLTLSEHTRVYLVEVDGRPFLVVESAQQAALHALAPAAEASRAAARAPWLQRVLSGAPR